VTDYDTLGRGYAVTRRADPRIAAIVERGLGDARSVVNVGAGAGSYEPVERVVTAVEPSATMIAQRPSDAAPVVQAGAEDLPFEDGSFDAAMAVLTAHHWQDLDRGLAEMRRVARRRVVLVSFDPGPLRELWFVRDYFPAVIGLHADRVSSETLATKLPPGRIGPVPVPRDCADLFFAALWARPEMVFDDEVVGPMWVWSRLPEEARTEGRRLLAEDLESGAWAERNAELLDLGELDVGLRLVTLEPLDQGNAEELWEPAQPEEIWDWLADLNRRDRFDLWLQLTFAAAKDGLEGPFLTRSAVDGGAIGSSRYLNLRPADRVVEIGWTWLNPRAWRTGANVEAKLLMLEHAFETLECVRVEFKTDARNDRSRTALAAIPAQFEGIMRNHMIVPDVGQRDSAYFSVIDSEWPEVRANLQRRLARGDEPG
jgi:RimJ/RimL family protein N-acetyltransferase